MTIPARRTPKPFIPTLVVDYGDDERYEVKKLLASELEFIANITGGDVTSRTDLLRAITSYNPTAWRALLCVMRKRAGKQAAFKDTDVDTDDLDGWYVDDTGREVHVQTGPLVCEEHKNEGVKQGCDKCDEDAPVLNEHGHFVYTYADDGEVVPVPTKGAPAPSPEPAPTAQPSGNASGSEPGTPVTATPSTVTS